MTECSQEAIFGPESRGDSLEERALSSTREFVRGAKLLAEASDGALGRRLSAYEALRLFGLEKLCEAVVNGQAVISDEYQQPASTIKSRRLSLGFDVKTLAKLIHVKPTIVSQSESPGKDVPIRLLEKIAVALALDERLLGTGVESGDESLGVRLRELLGRSGVTFSPSVVQSLAEGAWIIARQYALARDLARRGLVKPIGFGPSNDYTYPTYARGYDLALETRKILGISETASIRSMRRLIEDKLCLPLIETDLGHRVAGATVANKSDRGIVVNTKGSNTNVWVRRMTLAHELGHLLWDPDQRLKSLAVDDYDQIEGKSETVRDPIEVRANAFAISFLAPPAAVEALVRQSETTQDAIFNVSQEFGISVSASKAHVSNVCRIDVPNTFMKGAPIPDEAWRADEDYTNDFFPIKGTPVSRRGRFAWLVAEGLLEKRISKDTAAVMLVSEVEEISRHIDSIRELCAPSSVT